MSCYSARIILVGALLVGVIASGAVYPAYAAKRKAVDAANDPDQSRFDDPSLGRYMLRSSVLIGLELKRGWGSDGWGRTDFAKAFHLSSDDDFLNNEDAQEGAFSTLLAFQEVALAPLIQRYAGRTFVSSAGVSIKITEAGLVGAAQRAGSAAVIAYFQTYEGRDTRGLADAMPSRFQQVERRLAGFQNIPYTDLNGTKKPSAKGDKK
ncbi:hypothetical protein [Nitrospirillum sp. BR 11828]|uniref:hypothetical protein n=1 Tax=Nitrospirillum sp. BR 11828 TaxID=3104325 RepID=UPI002ACA4841|nr:hypothetical protein [Nitrospirillum sp. BR 11828]MDZ5648968.1 hypothetical protein [Nitrospirillum sp. BR 11828]